MKWKKENAYKIWDILGPFLMYVILYDCLSLLLRIVKQSIVLGGGERSVWVLSYEREVDLGTQALLLIILLFALLRPARHDIGAMQFHVKPKTLPVLLTCALIAVSFAIAMNLVLNLTGMTHTRAYQEIHDLQLASGNLPLEIAVYGILSPLVEEMIFRGIVLYRIAAHFGKWTAVIVSTLLFALVHFNLTQILYVLVMGILMGYLYVRYRRFEIPFLIHALANISVLLLIPMLRFAKVQEQVVWAAAFFAIGAIALYAALGRRH